MTMLLTITLTVFALNCSYAVYAGIQDRDR